MILASIGILILAIFVITKRHTTSYIKAVGQTNNGSSSTSLQSKINPKTNTATSTSSSNNSSGTSSTSSSASPSSATLTTPTGSFVSNHSPSLSNSRLDTEQSICNTTPGASCNVVFTNTSDNSTVSLGSKLANANGVVNWTWTLQSVGLTQGSWNIKAVASLNQQTKSASDPLLLNVQS